MGQTAAGEGGVTHSVQSIIDERWSTLHKQVDFHVVCHVGGHHEWGHTLRNSNIEFR